MARTRYGSRRRGGRGVLGLVLVLLLAAGSAYIYLSPQFERTPPRILVPDSIVSNGEVPLSVGLKDNGALKSYKAVLDDGRRQIVLASGSFSPAVREGNVTIRMPEGKLLASSKGPWVLKIEARDRSLWNFFRGNETVRQVRIDFDRQPPLVGIVANSPDIVQGGSALVIFQARDPNLKEVYVRAGGRRFEVLPYRKKGFYATLVAWPFRVRDFRAEVVATDRAGNQRVEEIPFQRIPKKYRVSWIHASDRFIDGKIAEVASQDPEASKVHDRLQRFKAVNEGMRLRNEKRIHRLASRVTPVDFGAWHLRAFYPLKGAKVVAYFGDERHYYTTDRRREVSRSYHLGYDLASIRHAPIFSSNPGTVVNASYNGIYGNMPMIDHGFGLYTLYGHCSSILVSKGQKVRASQVIARTGKTGLALGDHLHFGMLVQGIEVWPMDWMKQNWIRSHIDRVFRRADQAIRRAQ